MNLEPFNQKYKVNRIGKEQNSEPKTNNKQLNELFDALGGCSIDSGFFRIHSFQSSKKWTEIVCNSFSKYDSRICVFGFDWIGRQFAKDLNRNFNYFFDIATGENFEFEQTLSDFFNKDLIDYAEETLNVNEFHEWNRQNIELDFDKVVGYKIPLWLGGNDSIENYEITDAEINWEINRQLMAR